MSRESLFGNPGSPIPPRMIRRLALFAAAALVALPAAAATPKNPTKAAEKSSAAGPKAIGKFDDWTAATHQEGGAAVCYAFTRAQSSSPALPGRGAVILTVTERPS